MATAQTQIRKGRKFDQVVEGAQEIFLRDGFEGASVDDIARAAGVSKATLYSYFPDKRLLFMEVATRQCSEQARISIEKIDSSRPPARGSGLRRTSIPWFHLFGNGTTHLPYLRRGI